MTRALLAFVVAAAVVAGAAAAAPTVPSTLQQDVDALAAGGAPGVILLVRDDNRTVRYTAGFGNVAKQTPIHATDHFRIASLTKSFTSTVVLQLVSEGTLSLTDTVERWLPGLVPNGDKVTIHQLLNHTSGIFDFEADPRVLAPYLKGDFGHYWAPRRLVEFAVSHPPLFPPGTKGSTYSNTNYVIAGLIVEAATGKSIGAQLRSRIFVPLHLAGTSYPTTPKMPTPYAHGYLVNGKPPAIDSTGISPTLSPASGAIISTADDVMTFYRALLTGRLVDAERLTAMKTTVAETGVPDIVGQRYGLGMERFPTSCGAAWGHNGVNPGYFTIASVTADGRHGAVLMLNHDAASLPATAAKLVYPLFLKAFCSGAR